VLQKYLGLVTRAGLMELRQDGRQLIYKTTQKGLQFLLEYEDSKNSPLSEKKKRELDGLLQR
jgi:predicted transcriptional regulator